MNLVNSTQVLRFALRLPSEEEDATIVLTNQVTCEVSEHEVGLVRCGQTCTAVLTLEDMSEGSYTLDVFLAFDAEKALTLDAYLTEA